MIKVSRDEQENRVDSEHEDYADFDYDSIMADDKYSDFDFNGFMTIFYSDSSDVEDDMDVGGQKDYEPDGDSDSDSDSENNGNDDETPTLLTAVPPKCYEGNSFNPQTLLNLQWEATTGLNPH